MKVYKQKVRNKRELLTELGLVTWANQTGCYLSLNNYC